MKSKQSQYRFDYSESTYSSGQEQHQRILDPAAAGLVELSGKLNSLYCLQLVHRIWNICLVTLPLDLCLLVANPETLGIIDMQESFYYITMFLLAINFLTCRRDSNLSLLRDLKEAYIRVPEDFTRYMYIAVIAFGIVLAIYAGDAIAEGKIFSALIPLLLYGSAIYSVINAAKNNMPSSRQKTLNLSSFEQEILILNALPLFVARALSLSAALYSVYDPQPFMTFAPYFILSLFLLFEAFPEEDLFLTGCKGCGRKIPRSQLSNGLCTVCILRRKRTVYRSRGRSSQRHVRRKKHWSNKIPPAVRQLLQKD